MYPSSREIWNDNLQDIEAFATSYAIDFETDRTPLIAYFRQSSDRAKEMVEGSFPGPPEIGTLDKADNGTSNVSLIVGGVTAAFLVLMIPALGPISFLGIPAVIIWLVISRGMRETPQILSDRARSKHQRSLRDWEELKESTAESLVRDLDFHYNVTIASRVGVPKRLWPEFSKAMFSRQLCHFRDISEELDLWANEPEFPKAPGKILEGVSHEEYEDYCCTVMHSWGYADASVTRFTRDGGVDIETQELVVQCKHVAGTVGAPDVQRIYGIAVSKGKTALIFSAGQFSKEAIKFADVAGAGVVVLSERKGFPNAKNSVAREIMQAKSAGPHP